MTADLLTKERGKEGGDWRSRRTFFFTLGGDEPSQLRSTRGRCRRTTSGAGACGGGGETRWE
jgi:hypothetical protein